jgi:hypothetical protein
MLQAGRRMPFSIVERDGHIVVNSPYHPNFPARARGLGGEWDAVRHVWVFDAAEQDRVKALCREIYGAEGPENGKDGSAPFPNAPARGRNSNQFAEGAARPHYYGHRDRLRERMMAAGADTLPDYELLEMLLFAAYQRGDVKPLAKTLLAKLGGFGEVMPPIPTRWRKPASTSPASPRSKSGARRHYG